MANIFKPKRSSTASSVPTTSDLADGEIAVNSSDKKIYLRDGQSVVEVANASTDGSSLTNLNATNLASGTIPDARFPSALPAIDGSALTGITAEGTGAIGGLTIKNQSGAVVGTAGSVSTIDFDGSQGVTVTATSGSSGIATVVISADLVTDTSPQLGGTLDTNGNLIQFGDSSGATDDRLQFGAGNDLEIYHDTTNSYIKSNTNELKIAGKTRIVNNSNTESIALFTPDGSVELYYNNSKKFETTSSGVQVSGTDSYLTMQATSASGNAGILFKDSSGTQNSVIFYDFDDDYLKFSTNTDTEALRIDSAGNVDIGGATHSRNLTVHDATNSVILIEGASDGTSNLMFADENDEDVGMLGYNHASNYLAFTVNAAERFRITSSGQLQATGAADVRLTLGSGGTAGTNDSVHMRADGASLKFMAANGGNTIFETNGTETLRIDSSGRLLKSGQAALTSTSLSHPVQVAASSEANAIAIIGRAADDIGELSFYEADKSTKLGELQYRQDHLNFRHRVGDIRFATGGTTERLRIQSNGQILFSGTSGDNQFTSRRTNSTSSSGDYFFHLKAQNNSPTTVGSLGFHRDTATDDSRFVIATRNTGGSNKERLRITSSGNIGINNTSPQYLLHLKSNSTASSKRIDMHMTNDTTGHNADDGVQFGYQDVYGAYIWNFENTPIYFGTNNTRRATITSGGGVLIGGHTTAVDSGNAPNIEIVNTSTSTLTLARNDTSISDGNDIAAIRVWGNDSNGTYQQCAEILAEADGDHGTDDKPTALAFKVTADGGSSPTERLRIAHDGVITHTGKSGAAANPAIDPLSSFVLNDAEARLQLCATDGGSNAAGLILSNESKHFVIHQRGPNQSNRLDFGYLSNASPTDINNQSTSYLSITTGGDVGINQSSPTKRLHVVDARSSTYEIVSKFAGGNGTDAIAGISLVSGYSDTANDHEGHVTLTASREGNGNRSAFTVITADDASTSTEKFRITSAGNIGIGTDTPAYKLDLGESSSTIRLVSENNGTAIRVGAGGGNNDVTLLRVDGNNPAAIHGESDSANYGFSVKYMGSRSGNANSLSIFGDNQNNTAVEAITIFQDGKIGINNTSPTHPLHISKNTSGEVTGIKISGNDGSGDGGSAIHLADNETVKWSIFTRRYSSNNRLYISTAENDSTSSKVTITEGGSVGINDNNPNYKLSVDNGTTDGNVVGFNNDEVGIIFGAYGTGSSYPREATINGTRFDQGSVPYLRIAGQGGIKFCADLNSVRLQIGPSGQLGLGGANYGTSGQVLTSNGSGSAPTWQAAGGATNAGTLDGLDSSQFLRSDAADQKTSGNLRFNDDVKLQLGTSNDFQIYHDTVSTGGPDDVIHSSANCLRTRSNIFRANNEANSAVLFRAFSGGAFEAYHNGTKKFETASDGIDVSGYVKSVGTSGRGARLGNIKVGYDNLYNSIQTDDGTSALYLQYNSTGAVYLGYGGGTVYAGSNSGTVWHAGNDGSGSGLDADTLDGLNSGAWIRADATSNTDTNVKTRFGGQYITNQSGSSAVVQINGFSRIGALAMHRSANPTSGNGAPDADHEWLTNISGVLRWGTNASTSDNKIWHAGNDGSGSGLDADTLDGINSGSFLRSDANDTTTGTLTISRNGYQLGFDRPDGTGADWRFYQWGSGLNIYPSAAASDVFFGRDGSTTNVDLWNGGLKVAGTTVLNNSRQLSNITYGGNTIWHAGNDGSGSGLDADTVDGIQGANFLRSDTSDTMTGELNVTRNSGVTGTSAPTYSQANIEVQTSDNHVPAIGFHRGGYSAATLYEYDGQLYANAWVTRAQTGLLLSSGNIGSYAITRTFEDSNQNLIIKTGSTGAAAGIEFRKSDDGFLGQLYFNSTSSGFLNGSWASWDLQKIRNGNLTIRVGSANYTVAPIHTSNYNGTYNIPIETGNFLYPNPNAGAVTITGSTGQISTPSHGDSSQWNTAYGWGNHASAGYLTSFDITTQTDSKYLRSNADDTTSGRLTVQLGYTGNTDYHLYLRQTTNGYGATIKFVDDTNATQFGLFTYKHQDGSSNSAGNSFHFNSSESSTAVIIDQTSGNSGYYVGTNKVWHAGNDGSGSGLDADALDGLGSGDFLRSNASDTMSGTLTLTGSGENLVRLPFLPGTSNNQNPMHAIEFWEGTSVGSSSNCHARILYDGGTTHSGDGSIVINGYVGSNPNTDIAWFSRDGNAYAQSSYRAPIFYDKDNTGYYLNPASTSLLNETRSNNVVAGTTSSLNSVGQIAIYRNSNPFISFHNNTTNRTAYFQEASGRFYFGEVDYTESVGSFRAPVFYDTSDTAYYTNPAGSSILNGLRLKGASNQASGDDAILWIDKPNNNDWGIMVSGAQDYGLDLRMASSHTYALRALKNGTQYCRLGTDLFYHDNSIRSPIFYDNADTNYFCDPASTSYLKYLGRRDHNTGCLVGSYNNVGGNSAKSNPIYAIGSSYLPNNDTLANFYGIGYSHDNASFTPSHVSGWGMYVASDGDARVYLDAEAGKVITTGAFYGTVFYDYSSTGYYLDPSSSGTSLNVAGAIVAAGNVTAYSDLKFKEDIKVIPDAVEKVKAIRGVTYTRNDLEDREERHTGVIAQEVEQVLPEAVREGFNGKTVAYGNMVGLLIEAIKEQQGMINRQQDDINNLKQQIKDLQK